MGFSVQMVSSDMIIFLCKNKNIWPINNGLFPSAETLQMRTVQHDGFELLEI